MTIKFSFSGLLRTDVKKLIEDPRSASLTPDEVGQLSRILSELSSLHDIIKVDGAARVMGQGIDLIVTTEFMETTRNPVRSRELFLQTHEVLANHFVDTSIYRRFGQAFGELGLEMDPDLQIAVDHANGAPYNLLHMHAGSVISKEKERVGRREIDR